MTAGFIPAVRRSGVEFQGSPRAISSSKPTSSSPSYYHRAGDPAAFSPELPVAHAGLISFENNPLGACLLAIARGTCPPCGVPISPIRRHSTWLSRHRLQLEDVGNGLGELMDGLFLVGDGFVQLRQLGFYLSRMGRFGFADIGNAGSRSGRGTDLDRAPAIIEGIVLRDDGGEKFPALIIDGTLAHKAEVDSASQRGLGGTS